MISAYVSTRHTKAQYSQHHATKSIVIIPSSPQLPFGTAFVPQQLNATPDAATLNSLPMQALAQEVSAQLGRELTHAEKEQLLPRAKQTPPKTPPKKATKVESVASSRSRSHTPPPPPKAPARSLTPSLSPTSQSQSQSQF